MKLLGFLITVLAIAGVFAGDGRVCEFTSKNLKPFNGGGFSLLMPCKFWALRRQVCGKYEFSLSPGSIYIYPKFRLNTLWIGIDIPSTGKYFKGRTTNKLAVKHANSEGERDFVNEVESNLVMKDEFKFGLDKDGVSPYMEDINGEAFRVTFTPWDPANSKFSNPSFKFECFAPNMPPREYPAQMCGGLKKKVVQALAKNPYGIPDRFAYAIAYRDVFTNDDIVQTNSACTNATNLLLSCPEERRMEVIKNCQPILAVDTHTKCVTKYNCDPMEVFNSCLAWGCRGEKAFDKTQKLECEEIAEKIDYCKAIVSSGNLTGHVESAKCYKGFLTLV